MQFSLRSTVTQQTVHLHVDGELDIFTAGQVRREISQALWSGCLRARLDVTGVTFVDASALGVLVRARELMRSCGGTLEIVAFSPVFLRLCVLTELVSLVAPPSSGAELAELAPVG